MTTPRMVLRIRSSIALGGLGLLLCAVLASPTARAYVNQSDGRVVPETARLQACLDAPSGENMAGLVDAIEDAATIPEAYRPVQMGSGYPVTFTLLAEGGGYRNSFGWFWIGDDITNVANLRTIFGCRLDDGACGCPCNRQRTVTVDFATQPGFAPGRPIGFWLRTPERLSGGEENGTFPSGCSNPVGCVPTMDQADDCGSAADVSNRIYFTSAALNDDGDFVHFLVYRGQRVANSFYFGFEDLFRGGDNDFEDSLIRAVGLVPSCDPVPETCNNVDDDCDGMIDDNLTRPCPSRGCGPGVETCVAGTYRNCTARMPATETCDGTDQDCDTSIDEGISRGCTNMCGMGQEICINGTFSTCDAPMPGLESCNNADEDCDGRTDEMLTRPCASQCGSGTETCAMGAWRNCTARQPVPTEACDGVDQDCDGRVDEMLTRPCMTACGNGTERCSAGSWIGCSAPQPQTELCNDMDEDCDGTVDENLVRACATSCGVGEETCSMGAWVNCTAPTSRVEVCNNLDDDCDGVVDDGNPGGGATCTVVDGGFVLGDDLDAGVADGGIVCSRGRVVCLGGALVCQGGSTGSPEICNCLDDDCDGMVDEQAPGIDICPNGGACIPEECSCADRCRANNEFPCPPGQECRIFDGGVPTGYCVEGLCTDVMCGDNEICDPNTGTCRDLCQGVMCGGNTVCLRGRCVENNCYGLGCPDGQLCRTVSGAPTCVTDPCMGVSCGAGEFCRDGSCVGACMGGCPSGQICDDGTCANNPCPGGCQAGRSCVDGMCVVNQCPMSCGLRRICRGDVCVDDPCLGVMCPAGLMCTDGNCSRVTNPPGVDAGRPPLRGFVAGGGGLFCAVSPGASGRPLGIVLVLFLGAVLALRRLALRRRWRGRALAVRALAAAALAAAMTGCGVDPYCFENCQESPTNDAGPSDGAVRDGGDGGRDDGGPGGSDGCAVSLPEDCNERDDDCDGLVDETFDTQVDPSNCGSCGVSCNVPHAFPACVAGQCGIETCESGWVDRNAMPEDGCEYQCTVTGTEICDTRDNDCDGEADEGFDLTTNPSHCGACGMQCQFANATGNTCVSSMCRMGTCVAGYIDFNDDQSDGCEFRCTPTADPTEICDRIDNDCDRMIDEGFDLAGDPMNCGGCGRPCSAPNAVPQCAMGVCAVAMCQPGFHDIDGAPENGCEYACTVAAGPDVCDGVDQDCDGERDEDAPSGPCGSNTGACMQGTRACVGGAMVCLGEVGPTGELCNGIDDDCDSRSDESTAGEPIPGVGGSCGTNVGRCEFGQYVCPMGGGTLVCGGAMQVGPIPEVCNGVDDDCDGVVDDGVTPPMTPPMSCSQSQGVCAGRTPTCQGAMGWACSFPATYQATETRCDMLDNDCDGMQDEGCISPTGADVRLDTMGSPGQHNSLEPRILGAGSGASTELVVAWRDLYDNGTARIYGNRSINNGTAWDPAFRVDNGSGPTFTPQIARAGGTNVIAWPDFRGGTSYREIYSRRRTFMEMTPPGEVRVNGATGPDDPTRTSDSYNISMATAGNNVYVAFEAFTGTRRRQIFFSRSTDNGATWSRSIRLSTPNDANYVAAEARVAASGTNVYVVWRDNRNNSLDVFLARSTNSGMSFSPEVRLDSGTSSSFSAEIAANGNNVWVVWVDDQDMGAFDIWMNRSTNGGMSFVGATSLEDDPFRHDSIQPRVVSPAASTVIVAWVDYRQGLPDVMLRRSTNAGAAFSASERIDTGDGAGESGSYDMEIAASGNLVAAVWSDDRNGLLDVYANYSLDGGATFQPQDYRIDTSTMGTSDSQDPAVWVGANAFHVVWVDHRRGMGSACPTGNAMDPDCLNGDIYYRRVQ